MKLTLFVPNLLSWSGKELVIGGLERYAWALIELIQDLGWEVDVHQNGNHDWVKEVNGVKIVGHEVARFSLEAVVEAVNSSSEKVLYASILQAPTYYKTNSIIISHGVWWDGDRYDLESREKQIKLCAQALKQVDLIISCDYNFQNIMRAFLPELAVKIRVIPNFVDLEKFYPPDPQPKNKISILYPRRIDYCRGTDLFIEIANNLLRQNESIEILMAIDCNHPEANQELMPFLNQDRVYEFNLQFDDMPDIYQQSDIVVIPSRYSEGTSFSCLEAMASGRAIVATDVGGLTNLIINGYNGVLVPPRRKPLEKVISYLIENERERKLLGQRARQTAKAFNKKRWRQQWSKYLTQIYLNPEIGK